MHIYIVIMNLMIFFRNIVTHREMLLKELFTMTGEGSSSLETDHVLSFLKGGDVTQVDQDKWGAYLDKHKIR